MVQAGSLSGWLLGDTAALHRPSVQGSCIGEIHTQLPTQHIYKPPTLSVSIPHTTHVQTITLICMHWRDTHRDVFIPHTTHLQTTILIHRSVSISYITHLHDTTLICIHQRNTHRAVLHTPHNTPTNHHPYLYALQRYT